MDSLNFKPIGTFYCSQTYKYEAPRQSTEDTSGETGKIILREGFDFEQALIGLHGFERIWLVYQFNRNLNWKPMTQTPRDTSKQGIFATRSPYRPNPIGLSCVKLVETDKRTLTVSEFDLLDQTPILDIKPYVPACDSFNVKNKSWIEEESLKSILFSKASEKQVLWLQEKGLLNLKTVIIDQLSRDPINSNKKRVAQLKNNTYILSYRTWRIHFEYLEKKMMCNVLNIKSGYSKDELSNTEDKHQDKELHKSFIAL